MDSTRNMLISSNVQKVASDIDQITHAIIQKTKPSAERRWSKNPTLASLTIRTKSADDSSLSHHKTKSASLARVLQVAAGAVLVRT